MKSIEAVLVVDDDVDVLEAAGLALAPVVAFIEKTSMPERVGELLLGRPFDCVLLDMNFAAGERSGREGLSLLEAIKRTDPALSVVLVTAYGGVSLAVDSLKRGADDFLLKPWRNDALVASVKAAADRTRAARQAPTLDMVEREMIVQALVRHGGNIAQASSELGLSRPALYRRMEKHGI